MVYPSIDWHLSDCRRKRVRGFTLPVIAEQNYRDAEAESQAASDAFVQADAAAKELATLQAAAATGSDVDPAPIAELVEMAGELTIRSQIAAAALKRTLEARARWDAAEAAGGSLPLPSALGLLNSQISANARYGGFPLAGCTALVGRRGGMKSHLAYFFLLEQACGGVAQSPFDPSESSAPGRNCLLVSFRDDLPAAVETLGRIAEDQGRAPPGGGATFVTDLIANDRLEILENEPGKISPEEFFHNIFVAVNRERAMAGENQKEPRTQVVVVNGLDQLEARFPLIALADMFVPALIQLLKSNQICSVVISAVGESSTPAGQSLYGLYPMADLILRFEHLDPRCPPAGYAWPGAFPPALVAAVGNGTEHISRVETQRVPGGQIGERIGYLYREPKGRLAYARV
jgi:hypothetical protein